MKWDKAGLFSAGQFSDVEAYSEPPAAGQADQAAQPLVFIVDDDHFTRAAVRLSLQDVGLMVEEFGDCESFLAAYHPSQEACLVLDVHFPGMGGLELLGKLQHVAKRLPTVVVSGSSDISEAVQSMKSGATDFIEKPIPPGALVDAVRKALEQSRRIASASRLKEVAVDHLANLTPRQKEIMNLVLAGHPSKNIAADLGISQRTVENHRASIMHKTGATSLPALSRLVIAASLYRQDIAANT